MMKLDNFAAFGAMFFEPGSYTAEILGSIFNDTIFGGVEVSANID